MIEVLGLALISFWNSEQGRRLKKCEEKWRKMRSTQSIPPVEKGDYRITDFGENK